jgi:hypothetical protein
MFGLCEYEVAREVQKSKGKGQNQSSKSNIGSVTLSAKHYAPRCGENAKLDIGTRVNL